MQPVPQIYTPAAFPTMHGKAVSIFQSQGVQTEFAFFSDDRSGTYIVNAVSNTTKTLPPPPASDLGATFAASTNSLVVLGNDGVVNFLAYDPNSTTTSGGSWTKVSKLPTADFTSSLSPVSNGANVTNATSSASGSGSVSGSSNSSYGASKTSSSPMSMDTRTMTWGVLFGSILAFIGGAL